MAWTGADNLHTRLVTWLKVVLPLAALAILSTLFMVSRTIDPSVAIPYATVDVADRIREPRMTAPAYAGVTTDGAALTFTAESARPDPAGGGGGSAQMLRTNLDTPDGAHTEIQAQQGVFDQTGQQIRLTGGVQITTSSGYVVTTEALVSELQRTELTSAGAIAATSPLGVLSAGQMKLTESPDAPGSYLLVFKNRVKLIYRPAG